MMTAVSCFSSVPYHRSLAGREEALVSREVAAGDDVQLTAASAIDSCGWKDRLAHELPGCRAVFVINGHRHGDLVSITAPDGEHIDLAQTRERATNSLVRHATSSQLRLIDALMNAGLVLARM